MAILEVRNLKKTFDHTNVLKDISFKMEEGEALSIIGSSGSGKTTLLRCLNWLETADEGQIIVRDKVLFDAADTSKKSDAQIRENRRHFGLVFQSFNLFPQYTALENVMLAPKLNAEDTRSVAEIEQNARELLDQMGLSNRMDNYPHQLSGGQQQRVSIGRAIVKNPNILLCDEPTGALDYTTSKEILKLIEDVNKKYGNTIIMVTHNEAVKNMADHVIKLRDGVIRHNNINENKVSAVDLEW